MGLCLSLTVGMLTSCTPGNNTAGSTFTGAALGGILGGAMSDGKPAGVIAGALIGGVVGNQIGKQMDAQDRANMQSAITTTPVGQEATWKNTETDITYIVKPVKQYSEQDNYCREYQQTVTIDGKKQKAYGKACRKPDGSWQVVS